MEGLLGLALLGAAAWWVYHEGKRIGSRRGFNVGRSRRRRRH